MQLTNSTGQTVSLLNDDRAAALRKAQLAGLHFGDRSELSVRQRALSPAASSPSQSPLERGSSFSSASKGHPSRSPPTPRRPHAQHDYGTAPPSSSAAAHAHAFAHSSSHSPSHSSSLPPTSSHSSLLSSSSTTTTSSTTTSPPLHLPAPSTLLRSCSSSSTTTTTSPLPPSSSSADLHHRPQLLARRPTLLTESSSSSLASALEPRIDLAVASPFTGPPTASSTASTSRSSLFPLPSASSGARPVLPGIGHAHAHAHAHQRAAAAAAHRHGPQAIRPVLHHGQPYDTRKDSYSSTASTSSASPSDRDDSPVFSPGAGSARAPALRRHDSSSAASARSLSTPSPMTPTYGFDPLDQNKQAAAQLAAAGLVDPYGGVSRPGAGGPYFSTGASPAPMMPQPPGVAAYYGMGPGPMGPDDGFGALPPGVAAPGAPPMGVVPYATDLIEPSPQFQPGVASVSPPNAAAQPATGGAGSAGTTQQKARKKYPCPHAARYGCTDTFTTSGHAARHGKKHTGEKNILCPTCHKAFTRKDNMKQHERTHRNNRDSVTSAGSAEHTGSAHKRGKPNNHHASTSSVGGISGTGLGSDAASTGSMPGNGSEMDLDPLVGGYDPAAMSMRHGMPGSVNVMPAPLDFNHMTTANVFLDADLEAGGPSPAADDHSFVTSLSDPRKRPANIERQVSSGSQDGEGESPGLDALAMAASGLS